MSELVAKPIAVLVGFASAQPTLRNCLVMTRHVVARTTDIPHGGNKVVAIEGRDIVVFHVDGEFFALLNRCPHAGAPLDKAACVARLTSPEPGIYQRSRAGEMLRCAWHGWEFDLRNGQSWFDPKRFKIRAFPVAVARGEDIAKEREECKEAEMQRDGEREKGPYVAETFPVLVEDSYVIVEV
jgi:nitrite reductase/ring-hydroxylating ferredoxin subunit